MLHTSDWHLGQSFFTKTRKDEHQAFLSWLVEQVATQGVDLVIVAGDIFDTSTPPSYAREMYNQFIVQLQQTGCQLLVLGGNHDSVSVLNESRQLLAQLNTQVIASTALPADQQVVEVHNRQGEVAALVCAIPFVRPKDVLQSQAGESGLQKRQALGEAISAHYHDIYQRAVDKKQQLGQDIPILATGHLTALGVSTSDSVRDIYIGTLEGFAADGFPPADYIALGHIHRPQKVAKQDHIRYSGSPIPLSFDELGTRKQVVLVEFEQGRRVSVDTLQVPLFQPMAVHTGTLEQLAESLQVYANASQTVWLSIEVENQDYLSDLQSRIQTLTEPLNADVLQLRRARNPRREALTRQSKESLHELTPTEVFDKRLDMEVFEGDEERQRKARIRMQFKQVLSATQNPEEAS
ncbi:exonuclease subunit SbcD [Salinimonas lutimaris]|uniref:exonuclease subunit SbcD n=1 Tax=Salinimonas lutimaris TaxID=914153 RepID=UPI0038CD2430